MDFGLKARVVWILGAASPAVWDLAEAFLGEDAVVRLVTTRDAGWGEGRSLQLRAGRNLRIVTANERVRLLSATLLSPLLDAGGPDVIVLVRSAGATCDPSAHEWDQLLQSRVRELGAGGTVVVIDFDRLANRRDPLAVEAAIEALHQSHWTWSVLCAADCAVSLIALDPMAATVGFDPPRVRNKNRLSGLSALAILMASFGRGRIAMVTGEGSIQFI